MKKSLVIISFAFIFLLSVSIVSAGFWDWLTGDTTGGQQVGDVPTSISTTETFKVGKIATLSPEASLQITEVNEELGTVGATVTFADGKTQDVTLAEGSNNIGGIQIQVSDVNEGNFFVKDKATVSWSSPGSEGGLATGTEGATFTPTTTQRIPFTKGEYPVGDDVWVINELGVLTINGLYNAELIKGRTYDIPAFCSGNHRVTISEAGEMTIDTTTNTISAAVSNF